MLTEKVIERDNSQERFIPYNYSSFNDRDIILFFLGELGFGLVQKLSSQKITGVSSRMLYEILGDMWVVKRNPYIQEDLITNSKRRTMLLNALKHRLEQMKTRANGNTSALHLIELTNTTINSFSDWLCNYHHKRELIISRLSTVIDIKNIDCTPYARVSSCTDATDWRYAMPMLVVNPDTEKEIAGVISICKSLQLTVIAKGGATGYHGGVVPLSEQSVVLSLEKLLTIRPVSVIATSQNRLIASIEVGAGVVTKRVSELANLHGFVFAVDPTSQDASTIGGNIATNAGGKKALLWGTALDNLLSWKMIDANSNYVEIFRNNHNYAKIHDQELVEFTIKTTSITGKLLETKTIQIPGRDIRKEGLGKDVTKKHLCGLPGIQKEGCDGVIVSAVFILHQKYKYTKTICLEFYSSDMAASVSCIALLKDSNSSFKNVYLSALEHLDHYYIAAVGYSPKGKQTNKPNMLLLLDAVSDDEVELSKYCDFVQSIVSSYQVSSYVAVSPEARERFWLDRKRTAAIAKHTNAFKLNEDVVIPLPRLVDYSAGIRAINTEMIILNKQVICRQLLAALEPDTLYSFLPATIDEEFKQECLEKILKAQAITNELLKLYSEQIEFITNHTQTTQLTKISINKHLLGPIYELFSGEVFNDFRNYLVTLHKQVLRKRLFIALHMHAGDGNVHSNIPVHSDDPHMMNQAQQMAERIMKLAVSLDGVISGEHGIGITKISFLQPDEIVAFKEYKSHVDPEDVFNRGKLTKVTQLTQCYTPSFQLLRQESILLEESELGALNDMIKNCLRCGKCKPVCATHVPEANLLYSPRNKIIASSALIEAFLYEEQTRRGISINHFSSLLEVADHCTVCHKCEAPCPVDIDFGDVTMLLRKILRKNKKYPFRFLPFMLHWYLSLKNEQLVHLLYSLVIRVAMKSQALIATLYSYLPNSMRAFVKNPPPTNKNPSTPTAVIHFISRPLPSSLPAQPMRVLLGVSDQNYIPVFKNPKIESSKSVFYFPGCGSERLYSTIGLATIALLYDAGVQVALPPGYLCCGYPQRASGHDSQSKEIIAQNRVLFHRMSTSLNYLNISSVIVSCGTCYDQLELYQLDKIFPDANLIDIHEYVFTLDEFRLRHEKSLAGTQGERYLYHNPCHSPIKNNDPLKLATELLNASQVVATPRCCGESGAFAFERPDIATQVRKSKINSLQQSLQSLDQPAKTKTTVLTSCPACHQGISRFTNELPIESEYIVVAYANRIYGENWKENFVNRVRSENGLEKVLL
ncbi:MAG: DUF3683 domain-containing protein [Methylacidiphilales bacterium]|nr:DUF3683 domain-containing protein [Candidatus Methylacidiphilales bacterium]